jgi:hypothetical protein
MIGQGRRGEQSTTQPIKTDLDRLSRVGLGDTGPLRVGGMLVKVHGERVNTCVSTV